MSGLVVRGAATPAEVAAVLAVLARDPEPKADGYVQWRAVRRAALRSECMDPGPVRPA